MSSSSRAGRLWCRGCRKDYMVIATIDRRTQRPITRETEPVACPHCKRVARVFLPEGVMAPISAVCTVEQWDDQEDDPQDG